jgi:hypothetical protein
LQSWIDNNKVIEWNTNKSFNGMGAYIANSITADTNNKYELIV